MAELFDRVLDISKEIFYEDIDEHRLYELYRELTEIGDKGMKSISYNPDEDRSYIVIGFEELLTDVKAAIDKKYPDTWKKYGFRCNLYSNGHGFLIYKKDKVAPKNMYNLQKNLTEIRRYLIQDIIGVEKCSIITEPEYNKFHEIRKDPDYILPYLTDVFESLDKTIANYKK